MMLRVGEHSLRIQFNWADKFALIAGIAFFLFLLSFLTIVFIAAGNAGVSHLWKTFGTQAIELNLLAAGLFWVCLRAIDYLTRVSYRLVKEGLKRTTGEPWRIVPRSDKSVI